MQGKCLDMFEGSAKGFSLYFTLLGGDAFMAYVVKADITGGCILHIYRYVPQVGFRLIFMLMHNARDFAFLCKTQRTKYRCVSQIRFRLPIIVLM